MDLKPRTSNLENFLACCGPTDSQTEQPAPQAAEDDTRSASQHFFPGDGAVVGALVPPGEGGVRRAQVESTPSKATLVPSLELTLSASSVALVAAGEVAAQVGRQHIGPWSTHCLSTCP